MDRLWLLTEGMDALLADILAYRNDLATRLMTSDYENADTVRQHIKDLYKRLGPILRAVHGWRRDCLEALAMMKKYPPE